ncbi:MAG TPA: hypothetical protein P5533_05100 [Candidatus Cloacimonadota bacterium]|nr:hypothetical protein [Candidatus Cloacimonadota bacterium]
MNRSAKQIALRLAVLALAAFSIVLAACSIPGIVIKAPDVNVTPNETTTTTTGNADAHFIQPDDYFVTDELLGDREWIYVELAKMITPATPETKNQAQFLMIQGGSTAWKKYWMRTRIATNADITLGKQVIIYEGNSQNDIYLPPTSNQSTRTENWFLARIVDSSETFRGYVMVGGGYKVALNNLRVVVQ